MADFGVTEAAAAIGSLLTATAPEAGTAAALGTGGLYAVGEGTGLTLADVGAAAGAGGALVSAGAGIRNAAYQSAVAKAQATAEQQKANEDAAAGERAQITNLRKTDLALSRAQAVAAGSGTEATSPDVLDTEGRIVQQGNYNALSSLYEGQARARSDNEQAEIDLFKANQIDASAPLTAGGTILSGIGSFADRRLRLRALASGDPNQSLSGMALAS